MGHTSTEIDTDSSTVKVGEENSQRRPKHVAKLNNAAVRPTLRIAFGPTALICAKFSPTSLPLERMLEVPCQHPSGTIDKVAYDSPCTSVAR